MSAISDIQKWLQNVGYTQATTGGNLLQSAQANLPKTYSGTPILNAFGLQPVKAYAAENPTGTGFVSPIAPQYIGNNQYVGSAPYNAGSVQGSATQGGGGGGGGGNSRLQELSITDRNPVQESEYQQLLQQAPQQPSIDFDALIAPALQGLEGYIQPLQSGYETTIQDIERARTGQLGASQANIAGQQRTLESARTRQQALTESAADEARRQYAEIQQGLQSRYGGTTGTGAFATELAGRQTLQNIGNLRQGLSQAMLDIDNKLQQVQEVGRIAAQDIEDRTVSLKNQAKSQLDQQLASIRQQKGELQARKAELAANAIQIYQNTVNNVEAQNTAFKQNLFMQQKNAENQLKIAQQRAQGIAGSYNAQNYLTDVTQQTPVQNVPTQTQPQTAGVSSNLDLYKKLREQYLPQVDQLYNFGAGGGQ